MLHFHRDDRELPLAAVKTLGSSQTILKYAARHCFPPALGELVRQPSMPLVAALISIVAPPSQLVRLLKWSRLSRHTIQGSRDRARNAERGMLGFRARAVQNTQAAQRKSTRG